MGKKKADKNQKKHSNSKKCEKDGYYWISKCNSPKWVVLRDEGPLWGVQCCKNCGGIWTWGE